MDGTRNERVYILLASYVIGFITAYIAFGVVQLEKSVQFVEVPSTNMASVIASQQSAGASDTFLAIDKGGLVLIRDNQRTLLSATDAAASELTLQDGIHYAISDYLLSDDKSYAYFCELPTADAESCRPYTYSVDEGLVYPVLVDGQRVAFDAQEQKVSWSKGNVLIVE